MSKASRQAEILRIIREQPVSTQDQLLRLLRGRGITVTQATASRDIRELGLGKRQEPDGSYVYAVADSPEPERETPAEESTPDSRLRSIFRQGVVSVDYAQNLIVVRTMPGLASAACSAMDSMGIETMVGSLAGDDTGILIMRTAGDAERLCGKIHAMMF